ncbi:MAG TPA: hypothetical protein VKM55_29980 [Candidatus Lokiarchaeia archaeon]|nr:hypothetical protein [Candidatus Lokiarchaeia archaeon]
MIDRPIISSYTITKKTTEQLAFDVTKDVTILMKSRVLALDIFEGILIVSFAILLLVRLLAHEPFSQDLIYYLLILLVGIAGMAWVLAIIPMNTICITSIVLDKPSNTFSITTKYPKRRILMPQFPLRFIYPLDALNSLEMYMVNWGIYKGMYSMTTKQPGRYPGDVQESWIDIYFDPRSEQVQALKTTVEEFLASPRMTGVGLKEDQSNQLAGEPSSITCPRCGNKYSWNSKKFFCPYCGESLENP